MADWGGGMSTSCTAGPVDVSAGSVGRNALRYH